MPPLSAIRGPGFNPGVARFEILARSHSSAPPNVVWHVLADARSWAGWGPWSRAELEREGHPRPFGTGAVRALTRRPLTVREEITAFEPPNRMTYALRSGLPLRGYEADVTLDEREGGGTTITWRSGFQGAPLGSGWLFRAWLSRVVADVAERLARAAEREGAG